MVELLGQVEADGSSDAFYSSLCEAICRVSSMDRALIFRYDARARAACAPPARTAFRWTASRRAHVTVESAPIARQALVEDRVIDVDAEVARRELPAAFHDLLDDATLVCAPLSAGGRWTGVMLADRRPRRAAVATRSATCCGRSARSPRWPRPPRSATFQSLRARQLQERIDLAREVHEGVIQRLFGVTLAFSSEAELPREARERIVVELQAALRDLRRALQRPLGRSAPETQTTLFEEVGRLRRAHPGAGPAPHAVEPPDRPCRSSSSRSRSPCSPRPSATRTSTRTRRAWRCRCAAARTSGRWRSATTACAGRPRPAGVGMGLRLAALEALQAGGIVEFGEREPGFWRVRLAVPLDRA